MLAIKDLQENVWRFFSLSNAEISSKTKLYNRQRVDGGWERLKFAIKYPYFSIYIIIMSLHRLVMKSLNMLTIWLAVTKNFSTIFTSHCHSFAHMTFKVFLQCKCLVTYWTGIIVMTCIHVTTHWLPSTEVLFTYWTNMLWTPIFTKWFILVPYIILP